MVGLAVWRWRGRHLAPCCLSYPHTHTYPPTSSSLLQPGWAGTAVPAPCRYYRIGLEPCSLTWAAVGTLSLWAWSKNKECGGSGGDSGMGRGGWGLWGRSGRECRGNGARGRLQPQSNPWLGLECQGSSCCLPPPPPLSPKARDFPPAWQMGGGGGEPHLLIK